MKALPGCKKSRLRGVKPPWPLVCPFDVSPVITAMAASTILTKTTLMAIIHGVTAAAGTAYISGRITLVAGRTGNILMPLIELEARAPAVVEHPQGPAVGAVAAFTALPHCALVGIFFLMTGSTFCFCFGKAIVPMAGLAWHYRVHALQREQRKLVIKTLRLLPTRCIVTERAILQPG